MDKRFISAMSLIVLFGAGCVSITTPEPPVKTPEPVNAISVSDQVAASTTRIISVSLTAPGYVAVHADVNGVLGPVIAHSALLQAGTTADVSVPAPVADETYYWAMLHTDDGDGIFDEVKDLPTKDANGTVILQRFEGTK